MKLGIVYKNGKVINHRSLVKVILNPVLRRFNCYIGSVFEGNDIKGIKLQKGQKTNKIVWSFRYDTEYDYIIKKRRLV